ncbi:cytochrome c maturation protein CcmE [Plantactinospora mayteni]|uniref:cytochrome c maturation protein CcmE n=1 Tax=Plantactinospora mayteni TaxID=566021 RepID=UPI0019428359|nr:cytochrome c maturation protein CcmE [Plantactinospora mayteni]
MIRPTRAGLTLTAVVLAGTGLLTYGGLRGTLSYYRTPAEVAADPDARTTRARLGGTVVPGSVEHHGGQTVFRLVADGHEITVRQHGMPPDTFRPGQDAVVEGVLGPDGVFRSDQVLVRHGNEYRPADTDTGTDAGTGTGTGTDAGTER